MRAGRRLNADRPVANRPSRREANLPRAIVRAGRAFRSRRQFWCTRGVRTSPERNFTLQHVPSGGNVRSAVPASA
jgi:hypothetical protein